MNNIRLIVADKDGTLTYASDDLSPRTKATIDKLREHGIYFGIATGRNLEQQVMHFAEKWGFERNFELCLGMNGGEVYDALQDKTTCIYPLKTEWMREIMAYVAANPDLRAIKYYGDTSLNFGPVDEENEEQRKRSGRKPMIVTDSVDLFCAEETPKIMVGASPERIREVDAYFKAHPNPYWHAFQTTNVMIEFMDKRVSKGNALEIFCKDNNIDLKDVMAFGDQANDISMIKVAGIGVCLANGSQETKDASDYVTDLPVEEDGFADFIEKHIFIPNNW